MDHQRRASGVGDDVTFAPAFTAVYRARSGVAPPKTARTEAESMTAAEGSILPAIPKARSRRLWALAKTPALLHSLNRSQQVLLLTPSSLAGSSRQGMPPRST